MSGVLEQVRQMYEAYNGNGTQLALFFICILTLFFIRRKDDRNGRFIWMFSFTWLVIYLFPITAYIIMYYCIGEEVYWRMFWILPVIPAIAYLVVLAMQKAQGKTKGVVVLCSIVCILLTGEPIFTGMTVEEEGDETKLPQSVVSVCDMILEDAKNRGEDEIRAIVPDQFVCYVRQYDGRIRMPYGRKVLNGTRTHIIYKILHQDPVNFKQLAKKAGKQGCNYLVFDIQGDSSIDEKIRSMGYEPVAQYKEYHIYYLNLEQNV